MKENCNNHEKKEDILGRIMALNCIMNLKSQRKIILLGNRVGLQGRNSELPHKYIGLFYILNIKVLFSIIF